MKTLTFWLLMNAAIMMDWGQTRYIVENPCYHEHNGFIGRYPSEGRVNAYFLGSIVVNNAVYFALPKKHRDYYAAGVAIIEAGFVLGNNSVGIGIRF